MSQQIVRVDGLRTLPFTGISSSYSPLGLAFEHNIRLIRFQNLTDVDITVSFDGVTDNLYIVKSTFLLFDVTTNRLENLQTWCFSNGTQIFVKGSPSSGSFYVECLYGQGD